MKKNSTLKKNQSSRRKAIRTNDSITIGLDLGDKSSRYCVLDSNGDVIAKGAVPTSWNGLKAKFDMRTTGLKVRIAFEVGTHSRWVYRMLSGLGHEVIVANPRQVKLISQSSRKSDEMDAETLARLARVDPQLLRPIRHRGEEAHMDLMKVRVRAALVEERTVFVNIMRSMVKTTGQRLPSCSTDHLGMEQLESLPKQLQQNLKPLMEQVLSLTASIKAHEAELKQIARIRYPETELLTQVTGVGILIALTFVLTVDDPDRFKSSRDVGCYIGLRPRRSESGESSPQLSITKEGDPYLRTLLVQGAHYLMSELGPDTDLKRWGKKLSERGGKNAKKRAIIAVARKLAILLHHLWVSGEVYEPLRKSQAAA